MKNTPRPNRYCRCRLAIIYILRKLSEMHYLCIDTLLLELEVDPILDLPLHLPRDPGPALLDNCFCSNACWPACRRARRAAAGPPGCFCRNRAPLFQERLRVRPAGRAWLARARQALVCCPAGLVG